MLKKEIKIGAHYAIAHTSYQRFSVVRVDRVSPYGGWDCTKLSTSRTIRVKSAAKFRAEVVLNPTPADGRGKWVRA